VWRWWRFPCARGRAAAAAEEEEAGVEVVVEETGSSGIDDGGVESGRDLESFGMKSETTWDRLLFIGSKISAAVLVLNRTAADSFGI
jgi:hypothetical protein